MKENEAPGVFREEILRVEIAKAARLGNAAAICNAYIETARQVISRYPDMSSDQKGAQLDAFRYEIQMLTVRTKQDCCNALREIAMVLELGFPAGR